MSLSRLVWPSSAIFPQRKPAAALDDAKQQYSQALQEYVESLRAESANLVAQFEVLCMMGSPSQHDVVGTITAITDRVADKHTNHGHNRRHATNMSGFFERLIKLAPVGDVIVGGAQNLAVSGAWGAVRLALEVAVSYLTFFERVSDLLIEIGKFTEINHELAILFPSSLPLKALALEYLTAVIQIATKIVKYAQKSRTKQVFSSIFEDFGTQFEPLTTKLRILAESIRSNASVEASKANQLAHNATQGGLGQLMAFTRKSTKDKEVDDWRYRIAQHLRPKDDGHNWSYYFGKGRSTWLLNREDYISWKDSLHSNMLMLCGNLGSGKSVALASVCSDLISSPRTQDTTPGSEAIKVSPRTVSYFFCKEGEARSGLASTIIGSLAAQIVRSSAMTANLNGYLQEKGGPEAMELASESCIDFLFGFTPYEWRCYIVIDGLDQLPPSEAEALFKQLSRLSKSRKVSLCCSSHSTWEALRRVRAIQDEVSKFVTVNMDTINRSTEARHFIAAEMTRWEGRGLRFASSDHKRKVTLALMNHWGNMFLWLKLQMELIEDDLQEEDGFEIDYILARIHDDLSALYERSLADIARKTPKLSRIILQLIVGAEQAMRVGDLRIAANVEPGNTKWSPVSLPKTASALCSKYGGRLLEVDATSDEIRLIHGSVALHFCGPPSSELTAPLHFEIQEARDFVGLICVTYFNLPSLTQSLAFRSKSTQGSDSSQARGMAMVTQNALDESKLSNTLLEPVFRGRRDQKDGSVDPWAFVGNLAMKRNGEYILTDFLDYARTNLLTTTRSLIFTEAQKIMWDNIYAGNTLYGQVSEQLRDPKIGIRRAINIGHRTLFEQHVAAEPTSDVVLDDVEQERLMQLVLYTWPNTKGGPLMIPFAEWLYRNNEMVFRSMLAEVLRLAYISNSVPNVSLHLRSTQAATLRRMAPNFLKALVESETGREDFSSILRSLSHHLKGRKGEFPVLSEQPGWQEGNSKLCAVVYTVRRGFDTVNRVTVLMAAGFSPNKGIKKRSHFPLLIAVHQGDVAVIQALIQGGADVNLRVENETPLLAAIDNNNIEVMRCLFNYHARVEDGGWGDETALHFAVRCGHANSLEFLLSEMGFRRELVDIVNIMGRTALFVAIDKQHTRCKELLIEHGARMLFVQKQGSILSKTSDLEDSSIGSMLAKCRKVDSETHTTYYMDVGADQPSDSRGD